MYIQYMSDSANFSRAYNVRNYCGYLKNIVKIDQDCTTTGYTSPKQSVVRTLT